MSNSLSKMNPFPGLRPFTQEEDYLFFGREEQTLELLTRLGSQRFVVVVGTSGSGKSSLVRCGLLSELQGGRMRGAGAVWKIAVTHPAGNPVGMLAESLLDADLYDRELANSRENLLATLSRSHFGLVEAVKQAALGEDSNFLLVVDQFEEIFRFHETGQTQQEMANEFVSLLLEAAAQREVPIYVVLTMRSDFIGECSQFEGLAEAVNRGEFLIPRLNREQYKRVIEGPIRVAGGTITPRLLQRLLNDLGQQNDQLPCLQHALMRTWNVWAENSEQGALDLDDYQRVGRMSEALSLHADEVFDSLASDQQRAVCAGLFRALTVQESENRGVRRPQRLGRLCQILDVSTDELLPIIDAYRQQGVTFLMPSPQVALTDRTIIDISHESLMRVWSRLRRWVEEESQSAGIYQRLSESAALHAQRKAGLYRDPELGIALAWKESERPNAAWAEHYRPGFSSAMTFLAASEQASIAEQQARQAAQLRELEQARQLAEAQQLQLDEQRRAASKLRKMIAGLTAVALIAVTALLAALVLRSRANHLAEVASQEKRRAQANADDASRQRDAAQLARQAEEKIATQANADREIAQREAYRATIKLAESMLQGDVYSRYGVADILWSVQPDLRGWEWGYLMARCPLEQWALQTDQDGLDVLAASPDGRFLATAGVDGTVALWDSRTRTELWRQITGRAFSLAIDPQCRYVAIGASPLTQPQPLFRVLDLSTGRPVHEALATGAAYVAFSASGGDFYVRSGEQFERFSSSTGKRLASAPFRGWDTHAGVIQDRAGAYVGVHQFWFPSDLPRQCSLFDAQTLRPVAELDPILPDHSRNLKAMPIPLLHSGLAKIVYAEGSTAYVDMLDARSRKSSGARPLFDLPSLVTHLAYDPLSETIIAAGDDGTVVHLDNAGSKRVLWHGTPIRGLALLSDGRFITGGTNGLLKCWGPEATPDLAANTSIETASANATTLVFSGENLLYQNWVRKYHFFIELNPFRKHVFERQPSGEFGPGMRVIRPQTHELVVESPSGVSFFDLGPDGLKAEKNRSIDISGADHVAFDASGRFLVAAHLEGQVCVFDLGSGQRLPAPEAKGNGFVAINPAGTRAALLTQTGLQVWDVSTGKMQQRVPYSPGGGPVTGDSWMASAPVFHPDGEIIAFVESLEGQAYFSAPNKRAVVLWDTARAQRLPPILPETGIVPRQFVFSPDGSRIISVCIDAKLRIWDWRLGKELLSLSELKNVDHVAASPDELTIAYAGWNPSLRIAKALPWKQTTRRGADHYRAVDDLRTYTMQLPEFKMSEADEAEMLGDIHGRRGEAAKAKSLYAKAIEIWRQRILDAPRDLAHQRRLTVLEDKRFAAAETAEADSGTDVLEQAVTFWRNLPIESRSQPHLLHAQLRLLNQRLARAKQTDPGSLQDLLQPWVEFADSEPDNHYLWSGVRELLGRSVEFSRQRGEQSPIDMLVFCPAVESLCKRHPAAAATVAKIASNDKQFAASTKLWAEALTRHPTLADDHQAQHRYNAARAATLAAAGLGQDEPSLDDGAKSKLRRQAIDWLNAERSDWDKLLDAGSPEDEWLIVRTLSAWQTDPDLADVRDAASLARIPAEDHALCTQLWEDVAGLLKKAETQQGKKTGGVHVVGNGIELKGNLDAQSKDLIYLLKLEAGKTYAIDIVSPGQKSPVQRLMLWDGTGKYVTESDRHRRTLNPRIVHRADQDGVFRLQASSQNADRGAFTLTVREDIPESGEKQ